VTRDLAAIAAAALAIRLFYLWQIRHAPFFSILMGDSKGYDLWAQQIAAGDWIGRDVFYQAPLYPYFLGTIYRVAGHSVLAVRIVQSILGSVSCALVAHAAWRLFGRRAGLIAGIVLAIYPSAIFFDGLLQKTALDAFFTSAAIWILSGMLVSAASPLAWLSLGVVIGALSLTRENALALAALLFAWCAAGTWGRVPPAPDDHEPLPRRARHAAAFAAGLALLLVPVAIRNYAVGGGFYLTTSQFGPNLYLGNNAFTDGTAGSLIAGRGSSEYERQDAIDIAERAAGRTLTPAEVSSYWTGQTLDFIRSSPGAWTRLMIRKVRLLWNRSEAFDTESQESYAEWSWPMRLGSVAGHFGVLVPLAFLGVVVTWSDRRRLTILYAIALVYGASVVLFFIYARYRYPLVPLLVLFAAAALAGLPALARQFHTRARVLIAAAVLLLIVFTNWPALSATDNRAITEHNLGAALQTEGQLDAAIDRYRRAVAIKPDYVPSFSNLGAALLAKGQVVDAIDAYQQALTIDPDFTDARFNLGNAYLLQGDFKRAIVQFQRVLQKSPSSVDARTNLGVALMAEDRLDEAITELDAAARSAPRSVEAHRALGEALSARGRPSEALDHLQRAVTLAPRDAESHYALGRQYLQQQRLADAAQEFRLAIQNPPAPPEVYNELGVALASMGQLDAAIEQFQIAVRQQPGSAEVQRNLQSALAERQKRGR
jgi:tetratricopeptide (TPR) repeat protein